MNLLNNNGTINLSLIRYFLNDKELILNRWLGKNYSSILFTISICYENNLRNYKKCYNYYFNDVKYGSENGFLFQKNNVIL